MAPYSLYLSERQARPSLETPSSWRQPKFGRYANCFVATKRGQARFMSIHLLEQGQLVEVRNRPFIVTGVSTSTQPASLLAQRSHPVQPLVTLNAVEDDAFGKELQVIWEVEAGVQIDKQATLPTSIRFVLPYRLAAFLNAMRWDGGWSSTPGVLSQRHSYRRLPVGPQWCAPF